MFDSELVRRARLGDRSAFDELVARHRAAVYRHALGRVGDPQDADEVTQNAFVKAYLQLGRLRNPRGFEAWLHAITARESASWLRARLRLRERGADPSADEGLDPCPGPEARLLEEELRRTVREAVAGLPDSERRVADAFYLQGRSYREIREGLGLPGGSIAATLHRARRHLAARLQKVLGGLVWVPGLESWCAGSQSLVNGGAQQVTLTKAAVAAAVATAAVVASVATPPKPAPPAAKPTVRVTEKQPSKAWSLDSPALKSVARRLTADLGPAVGAGVAEAAEAAPSDAGTVSVSEVQAGGSPSDPSASTPHGGDARRGESGAPGTRPRPSARLRHVGRDEVVVVEDGVTRRFVRRDGTLMVEEDGRSRPATPEETRRFERLLDRFRGLRERAEEIRRRAESFRPSQREIERLQEHARRMAEEWRLDERRMRSLVEEMERAARDLRPDEDGIRRLSEELRRRAERLRPDDRAMRRLHDELRRLERSRPSSDDIRRMQREIERRSRSLAPSMEEMRRLQDLARELSLKAMPDAEAMSRLMEQVERLTRELGDRSLRRREGPLALQEEVQKMVEQLQRGLRPLLEGFGPIERESRELEREAEELGGEARRSDGTRGVREGGEISVI